MDNNTGEVAGLEKEASCLLSAGCHTKYRWKVIAAITSKLFSIRKFVNVDSFIEVLLQSRIEAG